MKKLIRITTIPASLEKLLENQLRFMKSYYNVIAISSDKSKLKRIEKLQEVPTFFIDMTRKITPLRDFKSLWNLYFYLKKEKPLIVHTHTPKAGTIGMIAAKLAGVKIRLHTVAGLPLLEAKGNKRKLLNAVEKLTYACATKIYPNSFGLKEIITEQNFCKSSKLKVLANGSSNGINTTHFDPYLFPQISIKKLKTNLGINKNDFIFILVGRLVSDKGINEMVEAFKRLNNEVTSIKLLLVGSFESDLDPLEKKTIEEIESNKNILAIGFQKDVRPYFALSDVLVFPSYREGFPNVVMQAGAMGLASIVTNINGCNEIIEDGKNGWIIPVKDEEAILNAMQNCLSNTKELNRLSKNSRNLIVNRYEQKVVWEAILNEYKTLENNVSKAF